MPAHEPKFVLVWTCCQCGDSGMNYHSTPGCPTCGNYRCDKCPVQEIKAKKPRLKDFGATFGTTAVPKGQATPSKNVVHLKMGASVGSELGIGSSALGPLVGVSETLYWLVPAHVFHGLTTDGLPPVGAKLVHPAPVDCSHGVIPKEIGVMKFWSGVDLQISRDSGSSEPPVLPQARITESDWALCEVHDDIARHQRYSPRGQSLQGGGKDTSANSPERDPSANVERESLDEQDTITMITAKLRDETQSEEVESVFMPENILDIFDAIQAKHPELSYPNLLGDMRDTTESTSEWGLLDIKTRIKDSSKTIMPGPEQIPHVSANAESNHISASPENQRVTESACGQPTIDSKQRTPPEQNNPTSEEAVTGDDRGQRQSVQGHLQSSLEGPDFPDDDEVLHRRYQGLSTGDDVMVEFRADADTFAKEPNLQASRNDGAEPEFDVEPSEIDSVISDTESIWSDEGSNSSMSSVQGIGMQALREVLADLFAKEAVVASAFGAGLNTEGAGAERIAKEFRHGLRDLGKALKGDSRTLEQRTCASRVRRDAAYITDIVRKRCDPKFESPHLHLDNDRLSREALRRHIMTMWSKSTKKTENSQSGQQESWESSDDDQLDPETEKALAMRMKEVEGFILNSRHMTALRERLQGLTNMVLLPTSDNVESSSTCRSPKDLSLSELIDKWLPQWFDFLLEIPAPPSVERMRWTCGCGKRLYDDYHGLTSAELEKLRIFLDSSASFHQAQSTTETQTSTGWVGRLTNWTPSVKAAVRRSPFSSRDTNNVIPMHNVQTGCPPANPQSPNATLDRLFLLFCVQTGKEGYGKVLQHVKVDTSKLRNDNELFDFLSQNYRETRNLRSRLSLRTVTEIGHCKVFVDFSKFISDLQRHSKACPNGSNSSCQCWPPSGDTGYRYMTQRSAEPYLMGKNYLLHHFHNPGCLDPRQNSVLSFVPIKKDTQLEGAVNCPMPGWGIYFEEGWDIKTICVVVTVLMIVTSIVLGVTWWKVESDFSGGWGVASFCVTAATLVVTVLVILGKQSY